MSIRSALDAKTFSCVRRLAIGGAPTTMLARVQCSPYQLPARRGIIRIRSKQHSAMCNKGNRGHYYRARK